MVSVHTLLLSYFLERGLFESEQATTNYDSSGEAEVTRRSVWCEPTVAFLFWTRGNSAVGGHNRCRGAHWLAIYTIVNDPLLLVAFTP